MAEISADGSYTDHESMNECDSPDCLLPKKK